MHESLQRDATRPSRSSSPRPSTRRPRSRTTSSSIPRARSGSGRARGARCGAGSPIGSAASRSPTAASTSNGWSTSRCWPTPTGSRRSCPGRAACGRTRSRTRTRGRRSTARRCGSRPIRSRSSRASTETYLSALADRRLWDAFRRIGIDAIHTGPVKMAGGLNGRRLTPSIDGHFDRISMQVDPEFGTEEEFRMLCATAAEYEGTIIDDIVPGHTGKGADFRLAEMGSRGLPGHLPHGLDRARALGRAARRAGRPRQHQSRRRDRGRAGAARLHHRPPPAGDLLRARDQGDQLERDAHRDRRRRRRAALGLPALLQGGPALHQLAGPELLRHAARDRRRAARARRPRRRRPAARRQRLPRRGEVGRGGARVVGGPSALARPRTT